ncbi:MAG TPA: bacterioferritin-associated ferredoxin [Candidatus Ignatzschineria merdigallinarum]|uniref:Bacterioferritin-associated ferredoxin n=1 Tax=Candidatus Ignatzschineria merdigallinarum TaxID=2838621 RepID=A0A9D1Q5J1_9GAMM|nr:bacterioferritin-associated ferredoxin [Candidatus Ignatzschineria merdigallinarum]
MYICLCNGITDKAIVEAVENGVTTFEALQAELGVATGCGSCADIARSLLPGEATPFEQSMPIPQAYELR